MTTQCTLQTAVHWSNSWPAYDPLLAGVLGRIGVGLPHDHVLDSFDVIKADQVVFARRHRDIAGMYN